MPTLAKVKLENEPINFRVKIRNFLVIGGEQEQNFRLLIRLLNGKELLTLSENELLTGEEPLCSKERKRFLLVIRLPVRRKLRRDKEGSR